MINYTRATTKELYGLPPEHEYGRWLTAFNSGISTWRRLIQKRITQGTLNTLRILCVGCGIGLMVEGLKDEGFQRVWGISLNDYFVSLWDQATCPVMDTGGWYIDPLTKAQSYIQPGQRWPCEVRSDVRPLIGAYDVRTMTATQVGTLTGLSGAQRKFDLILTEDVMTAYGPTEHEAVYAGIDTLLTNTAAQVKHYVSLGPDLTPWGGAPSRTLAQWQATLGGRTNHTFEDIAADVTEFGVRKVV